MFFVKVSQGDAKRQPRSGPGHKSLWEEVAEDIATYRVRILHTTDLPIKLRALSLFAGT